MEGSRDTLAKLMALVICAVLELLICVCAMLDARAALDARTAAVDALRDDKPASVLAARLEHPAPHNERRARSPRLAVQAGVAAPKQADAPAETAAATPSGPCLAWSREPGPMRAVPASPWRPPSRKAVFPLAPTHVLFVAIS